MSEEYRGQFINEIVDHPSFERIRGEILSNVDHRLRVSHEAFTSLATFSGLLYSGGVVAALTFIGSELERGLSYFAVAAFVLIAAALCVFAVCFQRYSQLMSGRAYTYAVTAQNFFMRRATLEEVLSAGAGGEARWLFKVIFWAPFLLAVASMACAVLALLSIGPSLPPIQTLKA